MPTKVALINKIKLSIRANLLYRDRVLIAQPLCGLANRLRVIASARLMAEHTDRKLFIRWLSGGPNWPAKWGDLFSNPLPEYPWRILKYWEQHQPERVKVLPLAQQRELLPELEQVEQALKDETPIIVLKYFGLFKPHSLPEPEYQAHRSAFYRSLTPITPIQTIVDDILTRQFANYDVIGVHIRRTDLGSVLKSPPQEVSPTSQFIQEMEKILARNSYAKFFLATDDLTEQNLLKGYFADKLIVYHKNQINRTTRQGIQDALIDWLLLSKTSLIIRSYKSSFSAESALVHQIPVITIGPNGPVDAIEQI